MAISGKTFIAVMLATSVICLAVGAAINWTVDPHNILGRNTIGIYSSEERMLKADPPPHRIGLFGSSKVTYIDPSDLKLPGVYNAGFSNAMPEEIAAFIRDYEGDLQIALIGLDYFMFNDSYHPRVTVDPFAPENRPSIVHYVLSGDVLVASLQAVAGHVAGKPANLAGDGHRIATPMLARHAAMPKPAFSASLQQLRTHYGHWHYAAFRLDVLSDLKRLLDRRHTRYRVFLNPMSDADLELLRTLPAYRDFARFKEDLRTIFPDLIDLTDSHWSDQRNFFAFDCIHYLPDVGAAFINDTVLDGLD